ncbi:hypothetical protein Tco_0692705, partial [Tanacetum coccineum]
YMQPEDLVTKKQLVEELKEEVKKELMAIKGSNETYISRACESSRGYGGIT